MIANRISQGELKDIGLEYLVSKNSFKFISINAPSDLQTGNPSFQNTKKLRLLDIEEILIWFFYFYLYLFIQGQPRAYRGPGVESLNNC